MIQLITLTRSNSMKRPMQIATLGSEVLWEVDSLANKLSRLGYTIDWNDNPKCILTRVYYEGFPHYCCVARNAEKSHLDKLHKNNITTIDNVGYTILIVEEKDMMKALGRIYNSLGRIPVH